MAASDNGRGASRGQPGAALSCTVPCGPYGITHIRMVHGAPGTTGWRNRFDEPICQEVNDPSIGGRVARVVRPPPDLHIEPVRSAPVRTYRGRHVGPRPGPRRPPGSSSSRTIGSSRTPSSGVCAATATTRRCCTTGPPRWPRSTRRWLPAPGTTSSCSTWGFPGLDGLEVCRRHRGRRRGPADPYRIRPAVGDRAPARAGRGPRDPAGRRTAMAVRGRRGARAGGSDANRRQSREGAAPQALAGSDPNRPRARRCRDDDPWYGWNLAARSRSRGRSRGRRRESPVSPRWPPASPCPS